MQQRQKRLGNVLAAPPMLFLFVFFVAPCALLILYSFWKAQSFMVIPEFNLTNYQRIIGSEGFYRATWSGIQNGFWTALLSVVLSFPVAYYIAYRTRSNAILYLVLLSWFSSYLVRVYAWRTILGTNGLINTSLMQLGLIDQPLGFLLFSQFATVLTLIHIMFPFALLLLVSSLREVKPDFIDAARDLGATRWQVLYRVILPMIHKGVVGSFMLSFILAAGDYVTPQLLGGRDGVTSGLMIANQFRSAGNWPLGAAMALSLALVFAVIYLLFLQVLSLLRLAPGRRYHD